MNRRELLTTTSKREIRSICLDKWEGKQANILGDNQWCLNHHIKEEKVVIYCGEIGEKQMTELYHALVSLMRC
jgi:hypothetical protein